MKQKTVTNDLVFRLLFLNLGLVIVGYALSVLTDRGSVGLMRSLKYLVLAVSMLHLLKVNFNVLRLLSRYMRELFLLSILFIIFALMSYDPLASVLKVLTYVVPFLYVSFAVGYLLLRFPTQTVLLALINSVNWVYFIPVVSYFVSGGKFTDTNIYNPASHEEGTVFISNHYGWASTIFLLTGLDLLRNRVLPAWRKLLLSAASPVALYLVLISGNRTSWLSLAVVALVFIFRYRRISFYWKVALSLLPMALVLYLLQDPDSAINTRVEKTRIQQNKGEPRAELSGKVVHYFNESPHLWVTGIGVFNKEKVLEISGWSGYHNSYYEVLFGAGVIVFAFFFYLIVIRPGWYYFRFFSTRYLCFLPLLIIPFFESNLTGGQFLFFPWFIMAILMGYSRTFAKIKLFTENSRTP